ncbi:MAG: hypothetical protein ACNYPI_05970 [Arenicellales bacterium WSBS_2016_MAG_OTU3]
MLSECHEIALTVFALPQDRWQGGIVWTGKWFNTWSAQNALLSVNVLLQQRVRQGLTDVSVNYDFSLAGIFRWCWFDASFLISPRSNSSFCRVEQRLYCDGFAGFPGAAILHG